MRTNKTNMFLLLKNLTNVIMTIFSSFLKSNVLLLLSLSLLLFTVSGCALPQEPIDIVVMPQPQSPQQAEAVANRFTEPTSQKPTVVESAMELSKKYAELSREAAALKQQNKELLAENQRTGERLSSVEAELLQAQKELTEANDLLVEMRIELNNWKTNVLGFREEMRQADTEQLKALFKILTVLGGEVKGASDDSNKNQEPEPIK